MMRDCDGEMTVRFEDVVVRCWRARSGLGSWFGFGCGADRDLVVVVVVVDVTEVVESFVGFRVAFWALFSGITKSRAVRLRDWQTAR
jgi:hypothetical protein